MAFELGYRAQVTDRFSWDVTGYCNIYRNLIWGIGGAPFVENTYLVVPFPETNDWQAQVCGVELSGQWKISESWRVSAWYSAMQSNYQNSFGTAETFFTEGLSPRNQAQLQSSWDIGRTWELDLRLRYVDTLPGPPVPSYQTMDLRLGWRPRENCEIALVGQNLLDNHHFEFGGEEFVYVTDEVRRTVFAQLTWRR